MSGDEVRSTPHLDAATAAAFEQALKTLRDAGARIDTIALPDIQDLGAIQAAGGFAAAESYTWHRDLLARSGDFIQAVLEEQPPQLGKDGLMSLATRATVRVRVRQDLLSDLAPSTRRTGGLAPGRLH